MKKQFIILLIVLVVTSFSAACIQNSDNSVPVKSNEPTGTIRVSGAFALYPMMVKWAEEYHKIHPGIKVEVSAGGAGQGMTDTLSGQSDLGMISRSIYPAEISKGAVWVSVTKDAVVPVVNTKNPVAANLLSIGMNKSTFSGIFIKEDITSWGATVEKPEIRETIHVYTRSDSSGAGDIWARFMGNYTQNDLKGTGVSGDPGIAEAVKNDPLGIGYNNVNFAYDPATGKPIEGLMVVPLDLNGDGKITLSETFYQTRTDLLHAIDTGMYPSPPARELNLVAKNSFSGLTKDFVQWILTDGQQYVSETGYIQLPKDELKTELGKLN
jgi:phosphate transport system substrate-binding protein